MEYILNFISCLFSFFELSLCILEFFFFSSFNLTAYVYLILFFAQTKPRIVGWENVADRVHRRPCREWFESGYLCLITGAVTAFSRLRSAALIFPVTHEFAFREHQHQLHCRVFFFTSLGRGGKTRVETFAAISPRSLRPIDYRRLSRPDLDSRNRRGDDDVGGYAFFRRAFGETASVISDHACLHQRLSRFRISSVTRLAPFLRSYLPGGWPIFFVALIRFVPPGATSRRFRRYRKDLNSFYKWQPGWLDSANTICTNLRIDWLFAI